MAEIGRLREGEDGEEREGKRATEYRIQNEEHKDRESIQNR